MYLYHATYKHNIDTILEQGLLCKPPTHNYDGMAITEGVFLAFDPEVAYDYVEVSEACDDEIKVLKIDSKDLNLQVLEYDYNNHCEHDYDINSVIYTKDIPAKVLQVCTKSEIQNTPGIDFDDLKHLDDDANCIWLMIGEIFDEQVGWAYEN